MDNFYDSTDSYEDLLNRNNISNKGDISISDQLAGFASLRISALTKAAEISPLVKEVTIGPNSPLKKENNYNLDNCCREKNLEEDLIEDKVREDLRYTLVMKKCENKLLNISSELFESTVEKILSKRAEFMTRFWKNQSEEYDKKALELKARKLQMLKKIQDNDNLSLLEQAKLDEKNCHVVNSQTIETMNRILEEQNRATARFAAITDSHTKICILYNEINHILNTESNAKSLSHKYATSLNAVMGNINFIMDICKTGAVTDKDAKQAEILALNIENIKKKISDDLDQLRKEEILKKQQTEEILKKQELEEKKTHEMKSLETSHPEVVNTEVKKTRPLFYSENNYKYFEELCNFLNEYEAQYKDLLNDVNLKKFRFDCQKAVNTPINALSSVSTLHMRDKFEKLSKLLRGERVQVLDIFVTATQHPQGLAYCSALLAKKIVRQGDLLVSSNLDAAFPLAAVTVALWSQFPHFGKLLEAYFHKYCPYLVPMYLPQKEGQTDKEFYISRGYTYNDEGVVEKQDKFLKRISGIFRLRCAIWITEPPKFLNTPNPNGICYGWKWLASFVNLKPEPDISATLLHEFFTICGSKFNKYYSKQFIKIIKLVSTHYLKILDNIDEGGPKTRLEVYLQTIMKTGQIPSLPASAQPVNW